MDGRTAAKNVLLGVAIGICVPILGAVVLTRAHPEFEWFDHVFTILMLSLACGGVGVLVNLPWRTGIESDAGMPPFSANEQGMEPPSGDDSEDSAQAKRRGQDKRHDAHIPGKRHTMSRRQALRTLELPFDADETAIRDAFRKLAKTHHPDHATSQGDEAIAQATARFRQVRAAYDVLMDEVAV